MGFAKCWYCVDQVLDFNYYANGMVGDSGNYVNVSTIKGDANLDSIVDIADLTTVAKYDLNNKLYPLVNDAAFSNADMNGDGEVNGLDTSALIENQLGK